MWLTETQRIALVGLVMEYLTLIPKNDDLPTEFFDCMNPDAPAVTPWELASVLTEGAAPINAPTSGVKQ